MFGLSCVLLLAACGGASSSAHQGPSDADAASPGADAGPTASDGSTEPNPDAGAAFAELPEVPKPSTEVVADCAGEPDMRLCAGDEGRVSTCRAGACVPLSCIGEGCGVVGPYFPFHPDSVPRLTREETDEPTLTDPDSTLMWTGCLLGARGADCKDGEELGIGSSAQAAELCDALEWAGHDDWFLPDLYAIASLAVVGNPADFDAQDSLFPGTQPAAVGIDPKWVPRQTTIDSTLWTSSLANADFGDAVTFSLEGSLSNTWADSALCVRLTRGTLPVATPRFHRGIEDAQLVAFDDVTRRMWALEEHEPAFYPDATDHCHELAWAGYDDWRLPTPEEVMSAFAWKGDPRENFSEELTDESELLTNLAAQPDGQGRFILSGSSDMPWVADDFAKPYLCVRSAR